MTWFLRSCRVWWCFLPLFALCNSVHADPPIVVAAADQIDSLETREVVVSATKTPVPISQVTSAVIPRCFCQHKWRSWDGSKCTHAWRPVEAYDGVD